MPSGMTLLSNYPVMRTSDAEYARDQILSVFDATSFEVPKGENRFEVCANHLQVGDLRLYYCAYAGDVSIGFGEVPFVRQIFNVSGKVRYSGRHLSGEVAQGSCSQILPAGIPLKFDFKSSYRHLVLRIEQDALQRYLGALIGQQIETKLVFDDADDQHAAMRRVRRMIFQLASEFNTRGALFSDLATAEMSRIAIMKLLMYSRHNYTHFLFRKPPTSNSSAVKTVEEFIEANWEKPDRHRGDVSHRQDQRQEPVPAIQAGPRLFSGGFRQADQARSRAGDAGASRGEHVGDADRAEMWLPEPRSLRP